MNKATRKLFVFLFAGIFALSSLGFAYAGRAQEDVPTVVFNAAERMFRFVNFTEEDITTPGGTAQTVYPDLFRDMKDLYPGDSRTQPVRFIVEDAGENVVFLMLRASDGEFKNADYTKLTEGEAGAALTITFPSGKTYTDDFLMDTDGGRACSKGVYVGKFSGSGEQMDTVLNFSLSEEAGNEYQDLNAVLNWTIAAEVFDDEAIENDPIDDDFPPEGEGNISEDPIDVPDPDRPAEPSGPEEPDGPADGPIGEPEPAYPKTGDSSWVWLVFCGVSAAGLFFFICFDRKRNSE